MRRRAPPSGSVEDPKEIPDPEINAAWAEPISAPPSDIPAWILRDEPPSAPKRSSEGEENTAAATLLTRAVDLLHDKAADSTGWEGWRLSPKEFAYWVDALKFLIRNVKFKDLPKIIALAMLGISEGGKAIGYMAWKKAGGQAANQELSAALTERRVREATGQRIAMKDD